ncbi:formyl transferase [Pelagophyceae sp. CCMP2097]|nr:formyl transferase [Pelagophyceae sp. CCMP2097]
MTSETMASPLCTMDTSVVAEALRHEIRRNVSLVPGVKLCLVETPGLATSERALETALRRTSTQGAPPFEAAALVATVRSAAGAATPLAGDAVLLRRLLERHGAVVVEAQRFESAAAEASAFERVRFAYTAAARPAIEAALGALRDGPPRCADAPPPPAADALWGTSLDVAWGARPPRVAIFVSSHLHVAEALLAAHKRGDFGDAVFAVVVSNHADAEALAKLHGLPFVHVPVTRATRDAAEAQQLKLLADHDIDVVVLARYMQVLSPSFCAAYQHRVINVHHSLLPAFAGGRPHRQAYDRGVKLIGATAHYATADLDDGPIISQAAAPCGHADDVKSLTRKGAVLESRVAEAALRAHLEGRIIVDGRRTVVFDAAEP